jgi:hypothetical protein
MKNEQLTKDERAELPETVWVWIVPPGYWQASPKRPENVPEAIEYRRVRIV